MLFIPVSNPPFRNIVGRYLHLDLVTGKDPDVMHPDFAGNMGKDFEAVLELDPELRVWKGFEDYAFYFN